MTLNAHSRSNVHLFPYHETRGKNRTFDAHYRQIRLTSLVMDPVTAVGVASAVVQFIDVAARALLKTIRLVRGLRDVPSHISLLLADVDRSTVRISYASTAMLKPGSKLLNRLSTDQFSRLSLWAQQVRLAMEDLHRALTPLCEDQQSSPSYSFTRKGKAAVQRVWTAVVSIVKQEEIARMVSRVDKLNLELMRELEFIALEIQAASGETSSEILAMIKSTNETISIRFDQVDHRTQSLQAIIQSGHEASMERLEKLASVNDAIQATNIRTAYKTSEIYSEIKSTSTLVSVAISEIDNIQRRNDIVSHRLSQINSEVNANNHLSRVAVGEIRSVKMLGDKLLRLLTTKAQEDPEELRNCLAALTPSEKAIMDRHCRRHLQYYPSSLRDVYENSRTALQRLQHCSCRHAWGVVRIGMWRYRLEYGKRYHPHPGCRFHRSSYQSWTWTLTAWLFPFLNQTVEFTLHTTRGAGLCSLNSSLSFRGTVRRASSPIFRAIDELPRLCATFNNMNNVLYNPTSYYVNLGAERFKDGEDPPDLYLRAVGELDWDVARTSAQLNETIISIRAALDSGKASGADCDEHGQSLLFVRHQDLITNALRYL